MAEGMNTDPEKARDVMIENYSFGHMVVDGRDYDEDLKVVGDRILDNWWRQKGHRVALDDLKDILSADPDILVIGMGASGNMRVPDDLRSALEEQGIEVIAEPTAEAAKTFDRLRDEGKNVAGAFHLTC
jgi:hypothetical protein